MKKTSITYKRFLFVLAFLLGAVIFFFTFYLLVRPAFSVVKNTNCNSIEHIHTEDCFVEFHNVGKTALICNIDPEIESLSHIHDSLCFNDNDEIICPLMEYDHIHSDECYDETENLICEFIYHQHTPECFHVIENGETVQVLDCNTAYHVHTDNCYSREVNTVPNKTESTMVEETLPAIPETEEPIVSFSMKKTSAANIDNTFILESQYIDSVVFKYKNKNGTWVTVSDGMGAIPADTGLRIEVSYKNINKNDIASKNNQIIYPGIPKWMVVDSIGDIYDEYGNIVADLQVVDENAVVTFSQNYLDSLGANTQLKGSFSIEGSADWREIPTTEPPGNLPFLDLNFEFEDNLSSKYGDFDVEKSGEDVVIEDFSNGETHYYLKYELKIKSKEEEITIDNITVTDTLSTESKLNISNIIKSPGYIGISQQEPIPVAENGFMPYEILSETNKNSGYIMLDNGKMKWKIDHLAPGEIRTLVYYVELNEKYVGSGAAGILRNEVLPESNGFPRNKVCDEFIPKADVSINKSQQEIDINNVGTGTITYKIEVYANENNSYPITNANINDSFRNGMANYVSDSAEISYSVISSNSEHSKNALAQVQNGGFSIPIERLEPGEKLTITYVVPVEKTFAAANGDIKFSNHASFVGDNTNSKLANGHVFNGSDVYTTIQHNQWTRKLNGEVITENKHIDFNSDKVLNYDGSISSNTSFDIPKNAQEYIVIVNEDGTWNMSGADFKDSFSSTRIAYAGYLKIEEFPPISGLGNNTNNIGSSQLLSKLNNTYPKQTVWVNIDGLSNFSINPQKLGLDDTNSVYCLTYYGAIKQEASNVKDISVNNNFNIVGTIGIGDEYIYLNGIGTTITSTITGNASYDFSKQSLFHENKYYKDGKGEIYWLIKANGTLPKDLQIKDRPVTNNSVSSDSLVGIYLGDKDTDLSKVKSFDQLNNILANDMTPCTIGTKGNSYELVPITSAEQLDGMDYAIFSPGSSISGYMIGNMITHGGYNKLEGERTSSRINNFPMALSTQNKAKLWHFELIQGTTKQFYIYYIDGSGTKNYLNFTSNRNIVTKDTPEALTIEVKDNKIRIYSEKSNTFLNWYGGNGNSHYAGWYNDNPIDYNNWHYLAKAINTSTGTFLWDNTDSIFVNEETVIPEDKSVYMIIRTKPGSALEGNYSKTFKNEIGIIDKNTDSFDSLDNAEYAYTPKKAVMKEPMVAAYYDAENNKWTIQSIKPSNDRSNVSGNFQNNFNNKNMTSRNGSGLYIEWLINVNWDGTLDGDVILTDYLDHKYEPVSIRAFWVQNPETKYFNIPELDNDSDWEHITIPTNSNKTDVPFYYNSKTGQLKIGVGNLHTGNVNGPVVNLQLICRVTDPDVILSGTNSILANSFDLDRPDGAHISDGIEYHEIRPAYNINKNVNGVGDDHDGKHTTNKLSYSIDINPNRENLIRDSAVMPDLVDEMSSNMELTGDIEFFKVVNGDEIPIDNIVYTMENNENTTKLKISGLPDETHVLIKYKTRVKTSPGQVANISNKAYWDGHPQPNNPQHTESFQFTLMGSVSSNSYPTIVITKLDFYNNELALNDAEFKISKVEKDGTINSIPVITKKTDINGEIIFDTNTTQKLEYNTVYQLIEIAAPTEYVIDDTPYYFIVIKNDDHGYAINNGKMLVEGREVDVITDYVTLEGNDLEMTVYNSKASVKVNKRFLNENGTETAPYDGTYTFGLYYNKPVSSNAKAVQVLAITYNNGNARYFLDGHEVASGEFTKARAGFKNYIYELDNDNKPIINSSYNIINGYSFEVTYDNNEIVIPLKKAEKSVTVINKEYKIYLPMTGAEGLYSYYAKVIIVFLTILALTFAVIAMRKIRKGFKI